MNRASADEFVELRATGDRVDGAHRCAECGYGVAVHGALPRCPMCGGAAWEPSEPRASLPAPPGSRGAERS